jgi:acyl carrier protein
VPSLEQRIVKVIADATGVPVAEVIPQSELASLGMGSLERIECVLNIEEAFEIELDEADLRRFRTVQDVIDAVIRAGARPRP